MKALKIIGILLLVIVVAVVIAMFVAPTAMNVERSIEINAPKALVHQHVSNLRLMNEWSPWAKLDPYMKNEYLGEDGKVGSINKWEGNDSVGKGEQEITFISADSVKTQVRFKEPFESTADAYIVLEETAPNVTKVTWGFSSNMARPFNIMGLFMDMEASIGADYQKGLDSLKVIAENAAKNATTPTSYNVEEVTLPETTVAFARSTVKWADMKAYYGTHFPAVAAAVGQAGKQPVSAAGIYYTWDETNQETDMGAGFVYSPAGEIPGYQSISLSGKALKVDHYGTYEGTGAAHGAIDTYLKEKGMKAKSPVLEQYIIGPNSEPDTTKWLTTIYYLIEE